MAGPLKKIIRTFIPEVLSFFCLAVWLLIRLWVPWGGVFPDTLLAVGAFLLSFLVLYMVHRFELVRKVLLPAKMTRNLSEVAGVVFLLGWIFDISYSMPSADLPPIMKALPARCLCHGGNGLVVAVLFLALVRAGGELKGLGKANRVQLVFIFIVLNLVTALYAYTSHTVYIWDNAGYWSIARRLAAEEFGYRQIIEVLETTLSYDYNYLLAFPISLVMRVFGGSRPVFLFALSNLYLFPGLWGLTAMANEKRWSGVVLCGLFPMLSYLGMVGFVDVICCAMGIWAYLIYTSDRPPVSRGVFTGALLICAFLCRRYFIFFGASFAVAAFLTKLFFQREDWQDFIALCCSGGVFGLAFALCFLVNRVIGADYGDIYSAYGQSLYLDFLFFCRYFGLVLLILFLVAAVVSLANEASRPKMFFGLVQSIVCFLAFVNVQTHGQQHLLLYLPALAFLALNALANAPQYMSSFMAMALAVYCFFPKAQPANVLEIKSPALFPSFHFYGPKRTDTDELLALADYIDGLSSENARPRTAAVLSSSLNFNADTLLNLRASLGITPPPVTTRISSHSSVDKRDAFPWYSAYTDYLIVGDPIQTHLGAENQQIMVLLANHILHGTGPGKAYEELPETFHLSGDITVRIFRRTRDWTIDECHAISDPLKNMYPKYADLYEIPDWIK